MPSMSYLSDSTIKYFDFEMNKVLHKFIIKVAFVKILALGILNAMPHTPVQFCTASSLVKP